MTASTLSRTARVASLTAALLFAGACSDSHSDENVTVVSARVERLDGTGAVTQTVTVTPSGATGGPLQLTRNQTTIIRITWLNAAGAPDAVMTDAAFEARFAPPSGSGLSFVLASGQKHTGTMTGANLTASTNVPMSLFHTVENHTDFDAVLPVSVVP